MSKKRRKPGRPARETRALPVIFRHSGGSDTNLKLVPHAMLDKILRGEGDDECWHTIVFRLNCGNAIANKSFAHQPEVQDEMEKALAALCEVGKRYKRTGKVGCTGDEFKASAPASTWPMSCRSTPPGVSSEMRTAGCMARWAAIPRCWT